jgi:hypothetical protein
MIQWDKNGRELAVSGTENWQKFRTLPSKVQTQKNAMNII